MSKALLCERCGKVVTKASEMNRMDIAPYVSMRAVSCSNVKGCDLCLECTETVWQYINNEVQMVLFKDKGAANQPQEERYENTING